MKNKRGFTMIELLAVIAILAILVVFAVPNVIKMLDKAKRNSFVTEVKSLYKAAEQKYISEAMSGNDLSGSLVCSGDDDSLDLSSNLEYCVEYDGDGKVINLAATNNKYNVALNDLNSINDIDTKIGNIENIDSSSNVILPQTLYSVFKKEFEKPDNNIVGRYGDNAEEVGHKDTYGVNGNKTIYYFKAGSENEANDVLDKNNVVFAGHCWQMLRTTDTGGVKLLYNGEAEYDSNTEKYRCYNVNEPTNAKHVGYVREDTYTVNSSYKYADDYSYSGGTFTLVDNIITQTWSDSTYSSLLGKYTCKTTGNTCNELYLVAKYVSSAQAKLIKLNNQAKYLQFGTLQFNGDYNSLGYAGYKYGKTYPTTAVAVESNTMNGYKFGTDVAYSGGQYTLVDPIDYSTYMSDETFNEYKKTHHYICRDGSNSCSSVGFMTYYYDNTSSDNKHYYYYVTLNGGVNIDEAVDEMLDSETNMYDSTIKIGLEAWYKHVILNPPAGKNYENKIEQKAIFCNRRDVKDANASGTYKSNGIYKDGKINVFPALAFKDIEGERDLECIDAKDQFSVANGSASLTYPIGLATSPEMVLLGNNKLRNSATEAIAENYYWLGSASYFYYNYAVERYVYSSGSLSDSGVYNAFGARGVVSIRAGVKVEAGGDGSTRNPYVID